MNINGINDDIYHILPFPYPIVNESKKTSDEKQEDLDTKQQETQSSSCKKSKSSSYFEKKYKAHQGRLQALPPHIQRQREEKAILEDPRLQEILNGETLSSIEKMPEGYVLFTEKSFIKVNVRYLPLEHGMVGPARFEISFEEKKPYLT